MKIYWAWVIALICFFGSLYYGEMMGFEPCRLCWYQRVCMFPLALFLGLAWYKDEHKIAFYSMPLVLFGGIIAFYQMLSQIFPALQINALCSEASPCTLSSYAPYFSFLGFSMIGYLIFQRK